MLARPSDVMGVSLVVEPRPHASAVPSVRQEACRAKQNPATPCGGAQTRVPGSENATVPPAAWRGHHTGRRVSSTLMALAAAVCGVFADVHVARAQNAAPPPAPRAADAAPDMPSADDALAAYRQVESWIRAWDVPTQPQQADPAGTSAATVTLRLSGQVMGRATVVASDGTAVWRAARDAWVAAEAVLPIDRDALRDERRAELLPRMIVDVQVAGVMTPLLGETFGAAGQSLSPGVDGVAARVNDRWAAVTGPTMLATGLVPESGLRAMTAELGLPPLELGKLRTGSDLAVYRFSSRQVTQVKEGAAPTFLYRGGRVVPMSEIDGPGLRRLAASIAAHIIEHRWPARERLGLTGDLRLVSGEHEPLIAPALDQAAAAMALSRYARTHGVDRASAGRAARIAAEVLADLGVVEPSEDDPLASAAACAMIVAATAEAQRAGIDVQAAAELTTTASARTVAAFAKDSGFVAEVPEAARGLVALALVELAVRDGAGASEREAASAAVRRVFRDTGPGQLVAQMPWLAWAELRLAPADQPVPAAAALRDLRTLVGTFRIRERDLLPGWADVEGGIVFTRGATPLPTWQGLRADAMLASMLGDPRLTDAADVPRELAELRAGLRFAAQLTIDPAAAHLAKDRDRAVGGVRPALWEARASLQASSLALMTICETLDALDRRSRP